MRTENFNRQEKFRIIELIEEYIATVENKKTDGKTTKQKDVAWDAISKKYAAMNNGPARTTGQIQNAWKNMKQKAKKIYASRRVERAKTGGGPPPPPVDDLLEKVFELIPSQIESLKHPFDDDSVLDSYPNNDGYSQDSICTFIINDDVNTEAGSSCHNSDANETAALFVDGDVTLPSVPLKDFAMEYQTDIQEETEKTNRSTPIVSKKRARIQSLEKPEMSVLEMAKEQHNIRMKYFELKMHVKREKLEIKKQKLEMAKELHAAKLKKYSDETK